MNKESSYDFAFSFAGEHREYVEKTVLACKALGLKVFYDKDKNNEWWGSNFISRQRDIYGSQTKFFVPFISPEYFQKSIPSDEFESAMMTAVERGDDYILPVIIGNPNIPANKLHRHTHYLQAKKYTPEQLAHELQQHLQEKAVAEDIAVVLNDAVTRKMPKVIPSSFSKYEEQDVVLNFMEEQFKDALTQLRSQTGLIGTTKRKDDLVMVRIERDGKIIYSFNVFQGGMGDDSSLGFNYNQDSTSRSSYHGIGNLYFDIESNTPKIDLMNLSLIDGDTHEKLTKEELFEAIWSRLIKELEQEG